MNYVWVSAGERVAYHQKLGINDNGDYALTGRTRNAVKHEARARL
jgi:hypothetical protein